MKIALVTILIICAIICTFTLAAPVDLTYNRVAYVDLDPLMDADNASQENTNMDNAVAHIQKQGVNTVYIQAYYDGEGYTRVEKMYYPNTALGEKVPGRNQFVKLANKFKAVGIAVGAWMPITAFQVNKINGKDAEYVLTYDKDTEKSAKQDCTKADYYCRLTPFNQDNFDWVLSIYKDLLAAYPDLYIINGHDDGAMNQYQDMSPSALAAYKAAGFPGTAKALTEMDWNTRGKEWALFKSQKISKFYGDLITELRKIKPSLKSSRNFYVNAFYEANNDSVHWFAQDCKSALEHSDYLAPMVFPYMEKEEPQGTGVDKYAWYFEAVIPTLKACDPTLERFQMCLQAVNWANNPYSPIPEAEFDNWVQTSKQNGIVHFGWYPSNHYSDATSPQVTNNLLKLAMEAPTACTTSSTCTSKQECINKLCVRKTTGTECLADTTCTTETQYCDTTFTNTCQTECTKDSDCTTLSANATCDVTTKKCQTPIPVEEVCEKDDDCEGDLVCKDSKCVNSAMSATTAMVFAFVLFIIAIVF